MDTSDPVRELVRSALSQRGLNMSQVSKALGRNHAYLHQFLDRGIPAQLPEAVREQLAQILQVPEAQLKGGGSTRGGFSRPARLGRGPGIGFGDKIPVFGFGKPDAGGLYAWSGETVDYVFRSPQLMDATQAYAVYVEGSGMEPRYYAGEVIYVHPAKPVTLGAFVLVQVKSEADEGMPRAAIRRLVRRTSGKVTLAQLCPPKDFDFKVSEVSAMHKIVGSAESSGL